MSEIHAFRGFAALCVVAAHAWSSFPFFFGGGSPSAAMQAVSIATETIFHDSTIFFALISGLLFSRILHVRGWQNFASNKLRYVVTPYIFLTFFFTYLSHDTNYRLLIFHGDIGEYLFLVCKNLLTGGAFFHLWYIPVLCLLYVCTPFAYFLVANTAARPALYIFILLPLVVSRQFPEMTWKNPIYFLGAYLVGMVWGYSYESVSYWCSVRSRQLIVITLVTSAFLVALQVREVSQIAGISLSESAWYIQKLAIAFLIIPMLAHSKRWAGFFTPYADSSFAIYFLHAYLISIFVESLFACGLSEMSASAAVISGGFSWAMSIAISVLLVHLAHRVLGKRSRMLLGS